MRKPKDIDRICAIKRSTSWDELDPAFLETLVLKWTSRYRRPGGTWAFFPHQAFALEQLELYKMLYAPMSVGAGKSFLAFFMGDAAGSSNALIVTKAAIRDQMIDLEVKLNEHFYVPKVPIWSYSKISSQKNGLKALVELAPDMLILDEAHCIRNKGTARTDRIFIYAAAAECKIVSMSATFLDDSLQDTQDIAKLTLGQSSPYPLNWARGRAWGLIMDSNPRFDGPEPYMIRGIKPLLKWAGTMNDPQYKSLSAKARAAVNIRLKATPGVVVYSQSSCDAPIQLSRLRFKLPSIEAMVDTLDATWTLPDGSEVEDILQLSAKKRELSQGGFYRWVYNNALNDDPAVRQWLYARNAFNKAIRAKVGMVLHGVRLDTPGLVLNEVRAKNLPCEEYKDWLEVRHLYKPEQEAIWKDDSLLMAAIARAKTFTARGIPTILFYSRKFVADRLEALGVPTFRAKDRVPSLPLVALSLQAHGTGLDLPHYGCITFLCPSPNASTVEQAIGRGHRYGQKAETFYVDLWEHLPMLRKATDSAIRKAKLAKETQSMEQKLLFAHKTIIKA